jgi:hypothetical protein
LITENTTVRSMKDEPPRRHGSVTLVEVVELDELVVVTVVDVTVVVGLPIVVVRSRRVVVAPGRVVVGPSIVVEVAGVASALSSEPPQPATRSTTHASFATAAITRFTLEPDAEVVILDNIPARTLRPRTTSVNVVSATIRGAPRPFDDAMSTRLPSRHR